jgi:hypothetical protein
MPIELGSFSIGAVAGGLVVNFANHILAGVRSASDRKTKEFNQAAAEFRLAFIDGVRLIGDSTVATDFVEIFTANRINHHNAIIRFMAHLCEAERTEIEKAWNKHCWNNEFGQRESDGHRFFHYSFHQDVKVNNGKIIITEDGETAFHKAKALATKNIEILLSFAKFK